MIAKHCGHIQDLVVAVQQAFLDAPALRLTLPDAHQRFGTDTTTCEAVLNCLVDARVLVKTRDGQYARLFPRLTNRAAA